MGVGLSHTDRPGRWVYLTGGAAVMNPPLPLLPGQTPEEMERFWQDGGWGTRNATQLCYRFVGMHPLYLVGRDELSLVCCFPPAPGFLFRGPSLVIAGLIQMSELRAARGIPKRRERTLSKP